MSTVRTTLTVATANIGRGETPAGAAANIDRVLAGFRTRPWRRTPVAIGWQEIDEADGPNEHDILRTAVQRHMPGGRLAGVGELDPIVIPPGWRLIREVVTKTCDGRAKVTPTRKAVQAYIEHEKTGMRVVLINGHYPHGAMDLWHICNLAWTRIVEQWLGREVTVLATRDRNLPGNGAPLSEWEQQLLAPPSIDKITVIQAPQGVQVEVAGRPRVVNMTIDGHNAHGVPLTLIGRP